MKRRNIIPVLAGLGLYVVLNNALLLLYVVIGPPILLFFGIPSQNVGAFWIEGVIPLVLFLPGAVYIGHQVTYRGWLYGLLGALVIDATGIASGIRVLANMLLFRIPPAEAILSSGSFWHSPAGLIILLLLLPVEGVLGGWWGETIRKRRQSA